ncbi:MAG: hypothetical protein FWG30_11175 [Eubacteriaceae bacterium]|nr:hypothetical protein [Eubacteriaceae bacterium]
MDNSQDKIMAALSYFALLVLVPFFVAKDKPFVKFHIIQGLNLLIIDTLVGIGARFFRHGIIGMAFGLLGFVLGILSLYGAYLALTGKEQELPIISQIKLITNI